MCPFGYSYLAWRLLYHSLPFLSVSIPVCRSIDLHCGGINPCAFLCQGRDPNTFYLHPSAPSSSYPVHYDRINNLIEDVDVVEDTILADDRVFIRAQLTRLAYQ